MSIVFFVVSFMGFFLFQDRLDRKCTSRVTSYSILGVRDMILAKGGVEGFGQDVCVWLITCKDKVDQGMRSKPLSLLTCAQYSVGSQFQTRSS